MAADQLAVANLVTIELQAENTRCVAERRVAAREGPPPPLRGARYATPSFSDAIAVPLTRDVIFSNAMSRATSGEPCFGLTSIRNGEKPQSSVDLRRSFGMCFEASIKASRTSSGDSTRGFCGLITPMKHTCATPLASARLCCPHSL